MPATWTPEDLAKVDAFVREQGSAWRLTWTTPDDADCPEGMGSHYSWQHREYVEGQATQRWVTKTRHATLAEFAHYHGVVLL